MKTMMKRNRMRINLFLSAFLAGVLSWATAPKAVAQEYGIRVGEIEITDENAADVFEDGGSIVYDHASRTLTLKDALVEYYLPKLLEVRAADDTLTIVLQGENKFVGEGFVIFSDTHLRFTGQGSLTVENGTMAICMAHARNLIIDGGCTLDLKGRFWGMTTWEGAGSLTVNASTLRVEGPGYGSLCDFSLIHLEGCDIREPEGAFIATKGYSDGSSVQLVALGDGVCKLPVLISPDPDGVAVMDAPALQVEGHEGYVRVAGVTVGSPLRCDIFTLSGEVVLTTTLNASPADIRLNAGIYMVSIDGRTSKVVVR